MAAAVCLGVFLRSSPKFVSLEHTGLDFLFTLRGPLNEQASRDVVIILVDDEVLSRRFGYYDPLPRRYLAELIDTLSANGAKVVALDVLLLERDRFVDPPGDHLLAWSMKQAGSVILANKYEKLDDGRIVTHDPDSLFMASARGVGFANLDISVEGHAGIVRSMKPFVQDANGRTHVAFSTLAYCVSRGYDPAEFVRGQQGQSELKSGERVFLVDGSMFINFAGAPPIWRRDARGHLFQEKAGQILTLKSSLFTDGIVPAANYVRNKVIFIGSASEYAHDQFMTPYYGALFDYQLMRGVEIHANAYLTLLHNKAIRTSPSFVNLLAMILVSILAALFATRMNIVPSLFAIAGVLVAIWTISFQQFVANNLWIPGVTLSLTSLFAFISTSLYIEATERTEKKRIQKLFGQYVNESVAKRIAENPETVTLAGELRDVTILFSDLKGFTTFAENLRPHELVRLMNAYFATMSEIILKNNGTVDKFIGDSIMAFWGAPLSSSDSAYSACLAALQMQEAMESFKEKWQSASVPELKQRVGINTGACVIGDVGYERKASYTVFGDPVNLASRLEGMNKRYGTSILISEYTHAAVAKKFVTRKIDRGRVDGKTTAVTVYELLAEANKPLHPHKVAMLEHYNQALDAYARQDWDEALAYLELALSFDPEDPVCKFLIERICLFKIRPPGPQWDGGLDLGTEKRL